MTLRPEMIKGYRTCPEHGHHLLLSTRTAMTEYNHKEQIVLVCPDERHDTDYWEPLK